jgi:hypothetical protein
VLHIVNVEPRTGATVEFLRDCFVGPAFPASVLLLCVLGYWLSVIVGALDIDVFDFDLDVDGNADSPTSVGLVGLRFLNIGEVPLMIWLSFFGLSLWTLTMLIDRPFTGTTTDGLVVLLRNAGLSIVVAKLCTQPLRGFFDAADPNPAESLVGETCVVLTPDVTKDAGQASFQTSAAPLLLNVRLSEGSSPIKGSRVLIVGYEPERNIYLVRSCEQET